MIEIHRLPGVQRDRARRVRVLRARPQEGMELPGGGVQTHAMAAINPRRGIRLPRLECDLAREQKLATAEERLSGGGALEIRHVIAAKANMHAPHLTVAEPKILFAG